MAEKIHDLTSEELRLFAEIVGGLSAPITCEGLREQVFPSLMQLLRSDFLASFHWNERSASFERPYVLNQAPENIDQYLRRFQFRDPMSKQLRSLWRPAYVEEAISRTDLARTEFFNDFLRADGLDHGINFFLRDREKSLADLRIWRTASRPDFGDREIDILTTLGPLLTRALSMRPEVSLNILTDREREVALLVGRGMTDKDIARILDIGFATVRTHLSRCFEKLSCSNRSELASLVTRLSH